VTYRELETLSYKWIDSHYIVILNRLSLAYSVVKNRILRWTPVQGITNIKKRVLNYRIMFQFEMMG